MSSSLIDISIFCLEESNPKSFRVSWVSLLHKFEQHSGLLIRQCTWSFLIAIPSIVLCRSTIFEMKFEVYSCILPCFLNLLRLAHMDYGVSLSHLQPRPQVSPLSSTCDMLTDILADFPNDSVSNFLLRTSPLFDLNFLSSPECQGKGLSTTALSRLLNKVDGRTTHSD